MGAAMAERSGWMDGWRSSLAKSKRRVAPQPDVLGSKLRACTTRESGSHPPRGASRPDLSAIARVAQGYRHRFTNDWVQVNKSETLSRRKILRMASPKRPATEITSTFFDKAAG